MWRQISALSVRKNSILTILFLKGKGHNTSVEPIVLYMPSGFNYNNHFCFFQEITIIIILLQSFTPVHSFLNRHEVHGPSCALKLDCCYTRAWCCNNKRYYIGQQSMLILNDNKEKKPKEIFCGKPQHYMPHFEPLTLFSAVKSSCLKPSF